MVDEQGENTVFLGIPVLASDREKFTRGTLVNGMAKLYAYYARTGDARAPKALERLFRFIDIAVSCECRTWGKLSVLRAMHTLKEAGLLDRIEGERLALWLSLLPNTFVLFLRSSNGVLAYPL
jgi:hypothetical protein